MEETPRPFETVANTLPVAPVTFVTSLSMPLYYEEIAFANKETVPSRLTSFGITSDSRAILALNFARFFFRSERINLNDFIIRLY